MAGVSAGVFTRRFVRLLVRGGGIVAAGVGLGLLWGVGIEPRLVDERSETARIPRLPPEWDGARVALFADLQVGMWLANTDTIRRIVGRLVQERPAAVLIAGDFLYEPTEEAGEPREARDELEPEDLAKLTRQMTQIVQLLAPLVRARVPIFAVLGNHDYAMQWPDSLPLPAIADELSRTLRAAGVVVLRNEAVPLGERDAERSSSSRLWLAGVDASFPRASDIPFTLAQVPPTAPRVFLMHNPQAFRELPPQSAPIAFAAHTHGGQVRLPFTESWSWISLFKEEPIAAEGWIRPAFGASGNHLYVNRGVGFSYVPIRLNCRPELTWFTLRPG